MSLKEYANNDGFMEKAIKMSEVNLKPSTRGAFNSKKSIIHKLNYLYLDKFECKFCSNLIFQSCKAYITLLWNISYHTAIVIYDVNFDFS